LKVDGGFKIMPRLRRFGRNIAASLEGEAEALSRIGRRSSRTLSHLGKTLATTIDTGTHGFEEDPVEAFLMSDEGRDHIAQPGADPEELESSFSLEDAPPRSAGLQREEMSQERSEDRLPAAEQQEGPHADPAPTAGRDTPEMVDILETRAPSQPGHVDAATAVPPQSSGQSTTKEAAPDSTAQPASRAAPPPTRAPGTGSPAEAEVSQESALPEPPEDMEASFEPLETLDTDITNSEPLSFDLDGQVPSAEPGLTSDTPPEPIKPLGAADPGAQPVSQDAEGAVDQAAEQTPDSTATGDGDSPSEDSSAPEFDADAFIPQEATAGGGGGGGSDSILDIFRAEDIEESPVTALAKSLDDVDIRYLLEKLKETTNMLKGKR
jgi:hypothetical protein